MAESPGTNCGFLLPIWALRLSRCPNRMLEKLRPSAFFGTPLASLLVDGGCDTVVLCGGTASGCVRASAVDAFSYGFGVCVVEEATFDRSETSRAVSLYEIDQKYGNVIGVAEASKALAGATRRPDGPAARPVRLEPEVQV